MEMFATNEELERLEQLQASTSGPARLAVLLPLAWFMCQRDSARARALLQEAQALLPQCSGAELNRAQLRIDAVRAHTALLQGQLQEAHALAQQVVTLAAACGAWAEQVDAGWVLAMTLADLGDLPGMAMRCAPNSSKSNMPTGS